MLKITKLFDKLVFRKNNSGKLISKENNKNNKVVRFIINNNSIEFTKKLRKLESQKLFKF